MSATKTTMYDLALDQRADQIEEDIYNGEFTEDIAEEIDRMISRVKLRVPAAMDAIEDMTLSDLFKRVARIRAESAIEQDTVSEMERTMQEDALGISR